MTCASVVVLASGGSNSFCRHIHSGLGKQTHTRGRMNIAGCPPTPSRFWLASLQHQCAPMSVAVTDTNATPALPCWRRRRPRGQGATHTTDSWAQSRRSRHQQHKRFLEELANAHTNVCSPRQGTHACIDMQITLTLNVLKCHSAQHATMRQPLIFNL